MGGGMDFICLGDCCYKHTVTFLFLNFETVVIISIKYNMFYFKFGDCCYNKQEVTLNKC